MTTDDLSVRIAGLLLGVLIVALSALFVFGSIQLLVAATNDDPAPAECVEDEPCWDCATMGNLVCGSR